MFYYLENTNDVHNKFYMISAYAYYDKEKGKDNNIYVSLQWGKIGNSGQVQHKEFKRRGEALDFALEKLRDKLNKGYEIKHTKEFRKIVDIPKANEKIIG